MNCGIHIDYNVPTNHIYYRENNWSLIMSSWIRPQVKDGKKKFQLYQSNDDSDTTVLVWFPIMWKPQVMIYSFKKTIQCFLDSNQQHKLIESLPPYYMTIITAISG